MEHNTKKSFFEKYQTFFSIVIAGLLIGGGIILARTMPVQNAIGTAGSTATAAATEPQGQTQDQVRAGLLQVADSLGLDSKSLGACLDSNSTKAIIDSDVALAAASGVQGTPTFFILKRTYNADGSVKTEKQIPVVGARDEATFMAAIQNGTVPDGQPTMTGNKIVLTPSDHYEGPKNAQVIIVQYSDIECPFCKRVKPVIDQILADHPEYAFVYRQSPIVQLHPWAGYKAQASECVFQEDGPTAFWNFLNIVSK